MRMHVVYTDNCVYTVFTLSPERAMAATFSDTKTINFRAPAAKRALIDHAAEISGKNRTDFILDASCEKAREVLADQKHFAVSRDILTRFNRLIDAPLVDAEALRRLLSKPSPWER